LPVVPSHIKDLASFCLASGINRFYASPGSRSAPILLALHRAGISIEMLGDERSAAYRALGYSLGSRKPAGIFCTSGTAVLNLGPAIAEAFYQQVPLFVLSADRPPELIDQQEGQAIRQDGLFRNHTLYSATVPSFDTHQAAVQHARRIYNQALYACMGPPAGPVHLNFPIREPFYPDSGEALTIVGKAPVRISQPELKLPREELSELIEAWNQSPRRLLVAGQITPDHALSSAVKALSEYARCPVSGDALHNLEILSGSVLHPDQLPEHFLQNPDSKADILLSIGKGVLSKNLKKYLKENPPVQHWHIQEAGYPADPFGTITRVLNVRPEWFITKLAEASCFSPPANQEVSDNWFHYWTQASGKIREILTQQTLRYSWSDLYATDSFLAQIPSQSVLCLANSMPVRYACWLYQGNKDFRIFSNRGTSGIDGCLSSAFGIAESMPEKKVFLLTGDMAFLYDRNAFWTNHIPPNLKILMLNNGGGNIFRMLPASSSLPELEDYFEMKQNQTSAGICSDAGVMRFVAKSISDWQEVFQEWLRAEGCAVLEVFTDKAENHQVLKDFKRHFS
jgi:2-succinyl-5-enolpyruvyl-6-hydroxy-3-cyclohexene-1-carboxylate synthase